MSERSRSGFRRQTQKKAIMFSLFRRRQNRARKYTWVPAVDANNPHVVAALLTFWGR